MEEAAVPTTDERLDDLEIRFSHQGRQLDELSDEVLGCYRRIERLERENRRLQMMLRQLAPTPEESPDE